MFWDVSSSLAICHLEIYIMNKCNKYKIARNLNPCTFIMSYILIMDKLLELAWFIYFLLISKHWIKRVLVFFHRSGSILSSSLKLPKFQCSGEIYMYLSSAVSPGEAPALRTIPVYWLGREKELLILSTDALQVSAGVHYICRQLRHTTLFIIIHAYLLGNLQIQTRCSKYIIQKDKLLLYFCGICRASNQTLCQAGYRMK